MLKSLLVYDNSGYIIVHMGGNYRVPQGGVQYIEVEHNENQRPLKVDVETNKVIFEDLPKTDIEIAKDRIQALEESNAELITLISMSGQNA
ncbi:hypothetical protein EXM65_12695 [Clostridium botulinum]|uniref:Uncharacterized protein n=1 Tax=Clostridium botulinum TaxID=1491 RepID=A0A6M0SR64_CLOBO|nr:hypothetical protein [Clostridium botulinum]NFO35155.1 hypothetical protein [Clostridium botulinum]NFO48367.1 hypothetical protein [Clostridium botulinum]NFO58662.1 hypothetical protein [Clostridium botulinum]